ncbi:hypothetical protein WN943_003690 [Citrus x changshan-huyou]
MIKVLIPLTPKHNTLSRPNPINQPCAQSIDQNTILSPPFKYIVTMPVMLFKNYSPLLSAPFW